MSAIDKEEYYRLVPQMRTYDALASHLHPFLGHCQQRRFSSEVVNTDDEGFRLAHDRAGSLDSSNWGGRQRRGILLGGSFGFSVGATADRHSLASQLSARCGVSLLNLSVRSSTSIQELIATLPFIGTAELVIVCWGYNDLVFSLLQAAPLGPFGPVQWSEVLDVASRIRINDLRSSRWSEVLGALQSAQRVKPVGVETEQAIVTATGLQKRTLRQLQQLAGSAKLLFVVQPFLPAAGKTLHPTEQALIDGISRRRTQRALAAVQETASAWDRTVSATLEFCAASGIAHLDLNSTVFSEWCFIDEVHMTDRGYALCADAIADRLAGLP
jgi:lysophospholipase L1-like esterase